MMRHSQYLVVARKELRVIWAAVLIAGVLTITVGIAQPAYAAPALVQTQTVSNTSSSTTIAATFGSTTTAGNLIIVSYEFADFSGSTSSCTDSSGNTYTTVVLKDDTINQGVAAICYAVVTTPGTSTVTANLPGSVPYRAIDISEYSGLATSNPVDATASNAAVATAGGSDSVTSGSATATLPGDLIFGTFTNDSGSAASVAAGTGFTMESSASIFNPGDFTVEDKILGTTGSVAATETWTTAVSYVGVMAAFKPTSSNQSTTASVTITPTFTFAVNGQASTTVCNGLPAATVGSTSTAVAFGGLAAGGRAFGVQQLQVTTNAGGGYVVYLHSTAAPATTILKGSGSHAIADTGSNVVLPGSGTEFFGYTTDASTGGVTSGHISSVPVNTGNATVGYNASAVTANNNCVGYAVGASATTAADTYSATMVYTAVPTF